MQKSGSLGPVQTSQVRTPKCHKGCESERQPVLTGFTAASGSMRKLCCSMKTSSPQSAPHVVAPLSAQRHQPLRERVLGERRRRLSAPQSCANSASSSSAPLEPPPPLLPSPDHFYSTHTAVGWRTHAEGDPSLSRGDPPPYEHSSDVLSRSSWGGADAWMAAARARG